MERKRKTDRKTYEADTIVEIKGNNTINFQSLRCVIASSLSKMTPYLIFPEEEGVAPSPALKVNHQWFI